MRLQLTFSCLKVHLRWFPQLSPRHIWINLVDIIVIKFINIIRQTSVGENTQNPKIKKRVPLASNLLDIFMICNFYRRSRATVCPPPVPETDRRQVRTERLTDDWRISRAPTTPTPHLNSLGGLFSLKFNQRSQFLKLDRVCICSVVYFKKNLQILKPLPCEKLYPSLL